ncbi:c-type cytochrome [Shimia biformata]|uniref:c-type cytochrome n=1 Tax=Shimia biformata TaxID=1294299 RepID=UPI00194E35F1|nr:c-type cytochrome [Shimia biformata]
MSKCLEIAATALVASGLLAAPVAAEKFGLGRAATPDEIAAWDLDVAPDGTGLPQGSGDVFTGEEVFAEKCAICHGDFAEGVDNWPKLAGGMDTLDHEDPLKTVGSYWPYLSTVWDYVNRSMPFGNAQSLTADEVYAITAYILYSNDLVDDEFELNHENFIDVELPNAGGFIIDDRETAEAHFWTDEPCMTNCKDSVEITMRAAVLDVTPEEDDNSDDTAQAASPVEEPRAPVETAALDPALVEQGEKVFKKCKSCHQLGDGAKNKTGPILTGIVDAPIAHVEGFKYSKPMQALGENGAVWTEAELAAFLAKPKAYLKGTKMSFAGLKKEDDIAAVLAYLQSVE